MVSPAGGFVFAIYTLTLLLCLGGCQLSVWRFAAVALSLIVVASLVFYSPGEAFSGGVATVNDQPLKPPNFDEILRRVCIGPDHDKATEKVVAMEVSVIGCAEIDATASCEQLVDKIGTITPICADLARVVI